MVDQVRLSKESLLRLARGELKLTEGKVKLGRLVIKGRAGPPHGG